MKQHFRKHDDEYLLSPAAALVMVADAIHSPDAGLAGKARAKQVLDDALAAARCAKFEQVDILETLLASRAHVTRLLPIFDALVKCVGSSLVASLMQRALNSVPPGEKA
jgi:hypothetical protein